MVNALGVLTEREYEVLALVAQGQRNRQIAQELTIAGSTVENHLHSIFVKLGVETRTEAAMVYWLGRGESSKIEGILHDRISRER